MHIREHVFVDLEFFVRFIFQSRIFPEPAKFSHLLVRPEHEDARVELVRVPGTALFSLTFTFSKMIKVELLRFRAEPQRGAEVAAVEHVGQRRDGQRVQVDVHERAEVRERPQPNLRVLKNFFL